jgi:acylphosphatase
MARSYSLGALAQYPLRMPSVAARHVLVSGRVQGVAFRWHARGAARELGVTGWIKNLADGRVEAWVEGGEEAVERMLAWLAKGPPAARVEGVEARAVEPVGARSFEVER